MQDKERRFFSPQERGISGFTIPDRLAQKGSQELR